MFLAGIEHGIYNYMKLISKYWQKNEVMIKEGIIHRNKPLYYAVNYGCDLKWFTLIFDLCKRLDTKILKDDFELTLKCKVFNKLSKQCQSIVKENYKQCYSQD